MRMLKRNSWPHRITVNTDNSADIEAIELWLGENLGEFRDQWNVVYFHDRTDLYFRDSKDATMFALRWL